MLFNFFRKEKIISHEEQILEWKAKGKPAPPPHAIKQQLLTAFQKEFNLTTLIETGTFLGDMVDAQKNNFQKIYSVELSEKLFKKARKRFQDSNHIEIIQGDSSTVLNKVVEGLDVPALFWLDGHYSGGITALGNKECPVPEELQIILNSPIGHVILIDDARLFNGTQSYPTVDEINLILKKSTHQYNIVVEDDIIRLTPA
ncbi:MAG: hypothetical protein WKF70_11055 [Chitinophagaceae bacterium]